MLTEFEQKAVLKLADAIEKGSVGKTQIRGDLFGAVGHACALGCAVDGLGLNHLHDLPDLARELGFSGLGWAKIAPEQFPDHDYFHGYRIEMGLDQIIISLNDICKWTFAEIVTYLRNLAAQPIAEMPY